MTGFLSTAAAAAVRSFARILRKLLAALGPAPIVGVLLVHLGSAPTLAQTPPAIQVQPSDQNVIANERASVSVLAAGSAPLSFQWFLSGTALAVGTSSNLLFTSIEPKDEGSYYAIVTNLYGAVTSRVARITVQEPVFLKRVTNGPLSTDLGIAAGCLWADFDNNGYLDVLIAQYHSKTNLLYLNDGGGQFSRVSITDFLVGNDFNVGVSGADYDNDGWIDYILTGAGAAPTPRRALLFRNMGNGLFERTSGGGITNELGYFPSGEWADFDKDGFVDLLISQSDQTETTPKKNLLWRNNGDGTFSNIITGPLVTTPISGWGLAWVDYDNDGLPDVFEMSSANGRNYLFHNDGNGQFTRVLDSVVVTDSYSAGSNPSGDWGDYDNDGLEDLFVPDGGGGRNHLYHNDANRKFSNVKNAPMLIPPAGESGRSCAWGDYDNDGYLDLLVTYFHRNVLYHNNHDGTFTEIRNIALSSDKLIGDDWFNTPGWVDYDNDGFLDLFISSGNLNNPKRVSWLYHSTGNSNRWLEVKCVGSASNRSAVGAKLRVKALIDGRIVWQMRELRSGAGWNRATPLVAHFGLGNATNVETLRIEWPSGTVQEIAGIAAGKIITVVEPPQLQADLANGAFRIAIQGRMAGLYQIERSTNLLDWAPLQTVSITNALSTRFTPTQSLSDPQVFYRAVTK